ncbi:hypothetical protein M0R45_016221 [Rubus argutus]|uniref:Uncharacterized protein n=1 Tax=Rubus argutus TaxID=59490 RepID=A0AAW1XVL1_RUBAR
MVHGVGGEGGRGGGLSAASWLGGVGFVGLKERTRRGSWVSCEAEKGSILMKQKKMGAGDAQVGCSWIENAQNYNDTSEIATTSIVSKAAKGSSSSKANCFHCKKGYKWLKTLKN